MSTDDRKDVIKQWCWAEQQIPCFVPNRTTEYCTICVQAKQARALFKIADNLRKLLERDNPRK